MVAIELRDYFAAHAPDEIFEHMTNGEVLRILKMRGVYDPGGRMPTSEEWDRAKAILRYRYADTMLKARESENK